jgi:two-component system NarL family sensor kinase
MTQPLKSRRDSASLTAQLCASSSSPSVPRRELRRRTLYRLYYNRCVTARTRQTRRSARPPVHASARDLRILKEIAEVLNGAADVDQALRDALARVIALLRLRTGWVWLIDSQSGRFYSATAQDLPPFLRDPVRMTGHTCWCIDAYRSGALTAGNIDVIECSRLRAALGRTRPATRGLRYHASIPLSFGDRRLGIMNLATPRWRKLTRRELDLLSTIASQVGVAIERSRLADESVRLARAEERARLARDLHDTLTQGLTAIGLHIEAAMPDVRNGPAGVELERALAVTRASLGEARQSLRDLRSSPLNGRSLADAIAALGRELSSETGLRVHVRSGGRSALGPRVEEELFRIAAEALTNIRRHAKAHEVEVRLTHSSAQVQLTIEDDGQGFDVRTTGRGFGIEGMRERARVVGGTLAVKSRQPRGTKVVAVVPLRAGSS